MNRSRGTLAAALLMTALALTACGGSGSSESSPAMRDVARIGMSEGLAAVPDLTDAERSCIDAWMDGLSDSELEVWTEDPIPQSAKDALAAAIAGCKRESATATALDGLAAGGATEDSLACVKVYIDGLAAEDFSALVVAGGTPDAIAAYGEALSGCGVTG